jgi:hypothetical protein
LFYAFGVATVMLNDDLIEVWRTAPESPATIAIFGASGTAGDGLLKAGKVQMTLHTDYLDYSAIHEQIEEVDAVHWAIGTSTFGVDEKTYGLIHVDFPTRFVEEWMSVSKRADISFHYISSSDISEDASMMWAREKVRAEKTLFGLAEGSNLRVIAYRPDYIGPTSEEAHIGQDLLYWFFKPVGAAVRATQIGQAMIEVMARGKQFENGDYLGTWSIGRYSDAYERRHMQE